jgi:heme/copper-type cytochrome/quinol oxidase subunit 4
MIAMQDPEPTKECCADLSAKFEDWKACAEKSVREEPIKTAGLAFVAGIFLTVLPVGSIISGLVRIGFALVRPALFILGVVKVVEEIDKRKKP